MVAIGYCDLHEVVAKLLAVDRELSNRGRVFLEEFLRGLEQIMGLYAGDGMPELSPSTKVYLKNATELDRIRRVAVSETSEVIDWLRQGLKKTLSEVLGTSINERHDTWEAFYFLPAWRAKGLIVGIGFGKAEGWKDGLLPRYEDDVLWLGIEVGGEEDYPAKKVREPMARKLYERLSKIWPVESDLDEGNDWGPIWRPFKMDPDSSLEDFQFTLNQFAEQLARSLANALTDFAKSL